MPNLAEVVAVFPNQIRIAVDNIDEFINESGVTKVTVGSYIEISDNDDVKLIAIIENYSIEVTTKDDGSGNKEKRYIIEAMPLGILEDGKFTRGGDNIAIPPKSAKVASLDDIKAIYESSIDEKEKFEFSSLSRNRDIRVPVNGDKFFNKHIAVVGSTGSGKSHTVSKLIQNAVSEKEGTYSGLNNSHIVIFDIHSEYQSAFPDAQYLDISNLVIPYWLLNSEELEDFFIDSEANDHNQRTVFQEAITRNKKQKFEGNKELIHYGTPSFFDIQDIINYISNRNNEKQKDNIIKWKNATEEFEFDETTAEKLFEKNLTPAGSAATGTLNGKFTNFINRLENKINDKRLDFLLGEKAKNIKFEETLRQFLSYKTDSTSNVTIIDLSGVPFEVLNITVSLISRLLFEFGFYSKKYHASKESETPLLLVYEEAHKYVPKSSLSKFRSSTLAIERIVKEGRKYGVTAMIVSQRPSEISETIFSQCSNFIAMRLTNPNDQSYVSKLLPDTLNSLINTLPSLQQGEAILIGEAIVMPSLIYMDKCEPEPSSSDIKYLQVWKEAWKEVAFVDLIEKWNKH
ncbi:MAG: ATP-binding protein [Epsilonproteobacteria bacterium]|nr:ATP-binding protein [Campylobacterota bacterium]